jgi:hypothetical protein
MINNQFFLKKRIPHEIFIWNIFYIVVHKIQEYPLSTASLHALHRP